MKDSKKHLGLVVMAIAVAILIAPIAASASQNNAMGYVVKPKVENFKNKIKEKLREKIAKKTSEESVENINNGIKITITTENEKTLKMLQKRCEKMNEKEIEESKVDVSCEDVDNGVEISRTSEDEDIARLLQLGTYIENLKKNIDREIKNTDNGVEITLSSEDEEIVTEIQSFVDGFNNFIEEKNNDKYTDLLANGKYLRAELVKATEITAENIDNGIKVTVSVGEISSENYMEKAIKKFQNESKNHNFGFLTFIKKEKISEIVE